MASSSAGLTRAPLGVTEQRGGADAKGSPALSVQGTDQPSALSDSHHTCGDGEGLGRAMAARAARQRLGVMAGEPGPGGKGLSGPSPAHRHKKL